MRFETADDLAVFFDPEEFGVAAVYRPAGGGGPVPLTVIHDEPSGEARFGEARLVLDSHLLTIQRSDVAEPLARDVVELPDGRVMELTGEPRLDRSGISWTCEARLRAA